jgi:uncharacterized protein YegL
LLGVITFDSAVTELLDFTLVDQVSVPALQASGMTAMGGGVSLAIRRLRSGRGPRIRTLEVIEMTV